MSAAKYKCPECGDELFVRNADNPPATRICARRWCNAHARLIRG